LAAGDYYMSALEHALMVYEIWFLKDQFAVGFLVAEKGKKSYVNRRNSTKNKIPSDRELQAKIRGLLRGADFSKVSCKK
jgi:hypothetical protein